MRYYKNIYIMFINNVEFNKLIYNNNFNFK